MNLTPFKNIKISEIIEMIEILDMPYKKAWPLAKEVCERHGLDWIPDGKQLFRIAKLLKEA